MEISVLAGKISDQREVACVCVVIMHGSERTRPGSLNVMKHRHCRQRTLVSLWTDRSR